MVRATKQIEEQPSTAEFAPVDWLAGITVVEVTTGVAAPLTGRILAELGAEVVKVESRSKLDVNRTRVPRHADAGLADAETLRLEGFGLLHEASASKKSVTLDLKTDAGRALFLRLLEQSDVFVENFAPGWLDRLGISLDDLLERCPRLIVLSATGYGQTGPLRHQRAYAPIMSALAGVEGLVGYTDGEVVGMSASAMADLNCAFYGAYLVLAALNGRESTGRGRHVDLSQTEASVALIGEAMVEYACTGVTPGPAGNRPTDGGRWEVVPCRDGEWIAIETDEGTDPTSTGGLTRDELVERLQACGVSAAPVLTPDEVRDDPGFRGRGLFQEVEHPVLGPLTTTSVPWHLDGAVAQVRGPSPLLGAHTEEIVTGRLGVGPEEFAQLGCAGVFH